MCLRSSSNILKNSLACTKSLNYPFSKRFFQQTIKRELLYPFSESQTSKALDVIQEASSILKNSRSIVLLDKLTTTPYSETYRAYDLENKSFLAQKNIQLGSSASWNQVNLILRQQQSSLLFAQTLSIEYDEKKQNVKIINELQNTILKDYSLYLWNTERTLLKGRIKPYTLQMVQQLDALRQLSIELENGNTIDPRKIFVEKASQTLRLYDLSDFTVKDKKSEIDQKEFFKIAKDTLLEVLNVNSSSAEFSLIFKEIEDEFETLKEVPQPDMLKSFGCIDEDYDQFVLDKISRVLIENTRVKDEKDLIFLQDLRGIYLNSAEAYQGKSDFEKAAKCYDKALVVEESLVKMRDKRHFEELQEATPKTEKPSTNIFRKTQAVLADFSYFTFKEIMTYVVIGTVLLTVGAVYEHFEKSASKQGVQKKEKKESSVFSSVWQKVKKLKDTTKLKKSEASQSI